MKDLAIGVSGINAVDNPGPGIGVARSLTLGADRLQQRFNRFLEEIGRA